MALYTLDLHRFRSHENALRYEVEKRKAIAYDASQVEDAPDLEAIYGKTR